MKSVMSNGKRVREKKIKMKIDFMAITIKHIKKQQEIKRVLNLDKLINQFECHMY